MYNYEWDIETGGYILTTKVSGVTKELRPVFYEELDLLGFNEYWIYPKSEKPLLWVETRRYIYKGRLVAEAQGGGLYTKPTLKIYEEKLELHPVDIEVMVEKNKALMTGLVQSSVEIIYKTFNEYKSKNIDVVYVAFSGGKDSIVLLDLVQRALPHNEFKVVFGDTSMEISDTYKAVERAKERWSDLKFYIAKSHLDAKQSWKLFGPPGRTQRWCCGVHKSAPSLLKLREITGMNNLRALAFDGVRAEESDARATYSVVSEGQKHTTQTNCSPILSWGTDELFLYIFENDLLLNDAYRYGSNRVGCAICPMSSLWRDYITNSVYSSEITDFIGIVENYSRCIGVSEKQIDRYIEDGGWKSRAGGRGLENSARIVIQSKSNITRYIIKETRTDWKEWIKTIGNLVKTDENNYSLNYHGKNYSFKVEESDDLVIEITGSDNFYSDKRFNYCIKNILNKSAYCIGCKVCVVECPVGALKIENGKVEVIKQCIHCEKCTEITKGCLVAKSLYKTIGGNVMTKLKGMNRYGTFGFRKEWLKYIIELGEVDFWRSNKLGPDQFDSFKKWLIDSELTENNTLTDTGKELLKNGVEDLRVWAVIAVNISYNSIIFNWYIKHVEKSISYNKADFMNMLGDEYNERTRSNALNSLINTFVSSPIGSELDIGVCEKKGNSVVSITRTAWSNPDPLVILYCLFKFAEKSDGYYSFTLTYLLDDTIERAGISPKDIFGIDREIMKDKLQSLATDYKDFISVSFNKDLDNIDLKRDKTSLDVVGLF